MALNERLSFMGRDLVAVASSLSAEEEAYLATECSHCCPNCDGPITQGDDDAAGICNDCYWAVVQH